MIRRARTESASLGHGAATENGCRESFPAAANSCDCPAQNGRWRPIPSSAIRHRFPKTSLVHRRSGGSGSISPRSEEHTYELQSLMRISYAVFCLKKTKQTKKT